MSERDLKINSISRYTKDSRLLVLEEHGHCEVPAGCGGVVLRWTNPNRGVPVTLRMFSTSTWRLYLDGAIPESGRPMITYGEHVLAFEIERTDLNAAVLLFAAIYDEEKAVHTAVSRKTGKKLSVLSAEDATWKYSTTEPQTLSWRTPGFDDSRWSAMQAGEFPKPSKEAPHEYRYKELLELGARSLTIAGPAAKVWIRKVFSLT